MVDRVRAPHCLLLLYTFSVGPAPSVLTAMAAASCMIHGRRSPSPVACGPRSTMLRFLAASTIQGRSSYSGQCHRQLVQSSDPCWDLPLHRVKHACSHRVGALPHAQVKVSQLLRRRYPLWLVKARSSSLRLHQLLSCSDIKLLLYLWLLEMFFYESDECPCIPQLSVARPLRPGSRRFPAI